MKDSNKKALTVAAIVALLFMTGFGGEPVVDDDDGRKKVPPKPDTPCPPGQHYEFKAVDGVGTWVCVLDDVGPIPGEVIPDEPIDPIPGEVVPDEPEPFDPGVWIKPYPTGDAFYQVVPGDQFFGQGANSGSITWRYLATEAHLAAVEFGGLDVAAANAFAAKVADNSDNRIDALNLICCAPYNDACYGTWGYDPDKDPMPAQNGRVIRLGPQNFDNATRLVNGDPLGRCVKVGSPQTKGNKSGVKVAGAGASCSTHELLWLPKLDREALWNSAKNKANGRATIDASPETWDDGTPRINPPPVVATRGVYFAPGSNTANVVVWGCAQIHTTELP